MKLRNIKAHFNLDNEVDFNSLRKIFRGCDATFTIHRHHRNVIHVTGVKSNSHLKLCTQYIENMFDVKIKEMTIDNQFFSHKDNKVLDLAKVFENIKQSKDHIVIYEPELSAAIIIKNKNRVHPTILLFRTGSFTFLGGKMENVKATHIFINKIITDHSM